MSKLEVYGVQEDGEVVHYADLRNSWEGAMKVWMFLADKYLGTSGGHLLGGENAMRPVWDLHKDARLSEEEWTVLMLTFDHCIVPVAQMEFAATACEKFGKGHYSDALATIFREMVQKGLKGVCFNQTSVSGSPWTIHLRGEEAEVEYAKTGRYDRPYNLNVDTKHWFFDRAERTQKPAETASP